MNPALTPAPPRRFTKLQVVLKAVERCNLACPYCYYFFMGDESYKDRPALLTSDVTEALCGFLEQGHGDIGFGEVDIIFHGGEPMMLPLLRFESACELFRARLGARVKLNLNMQTNGTLVTQQWVRACAKHEIGIGVSIDGPEPINDANRITRRGKGSYQKIVEGLQLLRSHPAYASREAVSSLTVLNARWNYREIIDHLFHELGFCSQNFLLPDCSHDDGIPDGFTAEDYGRILIDLFEFKVAHSGVRIREVERLLGKFQRANFKGVSTGYRADVQVIVVGSDGTLMVDDSYIPTGSWRQEHAKCSVFSHTLREWLTQPVFARIAAALQTLPAACESCRWNGVCRGGDLENRYSAEKGFDNPSVFCAGLQMFYQHATAALLRAGYPRSLLESRLASTSTAHLEENGFAS